MSDGLVALVLDDAGLLLADRDGLRLPSEPGVALADGGELLTGPAAAARRRRSPRLAYDRHWQEPDTAPLGRPYPPGLAAADLVHAHLLALWRRGGRAGERLLVAAPGTVSVRQLGVLLGVARAAEVPVAGLVDLALAAAVARAPSQGIERPGEVGDRLHVEIFQHRAVFTEVDASTGGLTRGRVVAVEGGWGGLQESWVRWLAETFLRRVRYDPLHDAAGEQELYDRLPEWLGVPMESGTVVARLEARGDVEVEVGREPLLAAVAPAYRRTLDALERFADRRPRPRLLLGARAAWLPDLARRLEEAWGGEVEVVTAAAPAAGALAAAAQIVASGRGVELPFVTRLTRGLGGSTGAAERPGERPGPALASPPARRRPTHLLIHGLAHRVPPGRFELGSAPSPDAPGLTLPAAAGVEARHATLARSGDGEIELVAHGPTFLGETRVADRRLTAGDRLRLGTPGVEIELIALVDEG